MLHLESEFESFAPSIFDEVVLKMSIPFVFGRKVMMNMQSFLLLVCLIQLTTLRSTSTTHDEETV